MKTILLADDSITIQKVVELTFSEGDYQVICVSNGTEALKKARDLRPNVALLDIIMPEKNGYEVCEEMKRNPATAGIPVLLLTGTFEPFDEKRADAVGAAGHLTKPFESHALVSRVDELIAAGGEDANIEGAAPAGDAVAPAAAPGSASSQVAAVSSSVEGGAQPASATAPASELPPAALAVPSPYSEDTPSGPAPIGSAPDPDDGGSFRASAPFDLGSVDEEAAPDRFDAPTPPVGDTGRLSRDDLVAAGQQRGDAPAPTAPAEEQAPVAPMEGFVSGYEMPEPGNFSPSSHEAVEVGGETAATPVINQEMIDRIAEQVVQRMSDRAVREIAWEVIPQVAEAIVRNRIKELEEQGEG